MKTSDKRILDTLLAEIVRHDRPENRSNYQRFHKEKLKEPVGLKSPVLRKISNVVYREVKERPIADLLGLCDNLLASGKRYMRFFAFDWALKARKHYRRQDFKLFEQWLKKHVNNWGSCDHLCTGPIGFLVLQYSELSSRVHKWTGSRNRWLRRGAAVSLIVPVKNGLLLDELFRTADTLLTDSDDMVQKGYGWMLKEASNVFPDEVFQYVMKNKQSMPRTALRYASEKLPPDKRKQAMAKS